MTREMLKNVEQVSLRDYFSSGKFRTVKDEGMMSEGGISEIKVIVEMREAFAKTLNFKCSSMLMIYGFAIMNDRLREINKDKYVSYFGKGVLKRIVLSDYGDKFIMVFELSDGPDKVVTVQSDQVRELLNNCMYAAEE